MPNRPGQEPDPSLRIGTTTITQAYSHPTSSTSGPDILPPNNLSHPDSQQHRPTAPNLIFGGHADSGTSSPRPPMQAGTSTGVHAAVHPAAPPFVPHGHAYHFSEPYAGPGFSPPFVPGPNTYYQGPPHFSQTRPYYPGYYQFAPPDRQPDEFSFPPRVQPPQPRPNQYYQRAPMTTREHSRNIHPALMETPSSNQQTNPYPVRGHTATQPDCRSPRDSRTSSDPPLERDMQHDPQAAAALSCYLHRQFGNLKFADSLLRFQHSMNIFPTDAIPAHGLVLARSPKLDSLMAMPDQSFENSMKVLHVMIPDRFLSNSAAFLKAIHRLYAEPLPEVNELPPGEMYFALSFAAAGHFLQVDEIVSRGLDLATSQLRWDTVNKALAFALDGGLSASWVQRDSSSEDLDSSSSLEDTPPKLGSPTSAPTYGSYSDRLLNAVLEFLVLNCPKDFKFLSDAPQLADSPRLPQEAEYRHIRSGSRLSRIRFGEMTLDSDAPPQNPVITTWSSVLVSLPFPMLKHVLEHPDMVDKLGQGPAAELMQSVVDEREKRRRRVFITTNPARLESALEERLWWQNVQWAEATESSQLHPAGLKVVRRRLGEETPSSSQSAES